MKYAFIEEQRTQHSVRRDVQASQRFARRIL